MTSYENIYNLLPIIVFLYLFRTSAYKDISLFPHRGSEIRAHYD